MESTRHFTTLAVNHDAKHVLTPVPCVVMSPVYVAVASATTKAVTVEARSFAFVDVLDTANVMCSPGPVGPRVFPVGGV